MERHSRTKLPDWFHGSDCVPSLFKLLGEQIAGF